MGNELISIIMSTYKETIQDIDRAVISIQKQTYSHFEFIIICDNPSYDELIAYLKALAVKDNRIKTYINETNMGLTDSLNKALTYAQGMYIARMDADDYSMPERLAHQKAFLENKGYDVIGAYVECVDDMGNTLYCLKNMPVDFASVKKKCLYNNPLAHPAWFGKKVVFDTNQGYRSIPYAEDYDFLLRAITHGFRLGNINEILCKYTIRTASISTSNGLKQYLVSQMLIRAYKDQALDKLNPEDIHIALRNVKYSDEVKYAKAASLFTKAVKKAEKHNVTFIFDVLAACFASKYYVRKIIGYIKAFY